MSHCDFDDIVDRQKSYSLKWLSGKHALSAEEQAADPLPMWVADMDFKAPTPVIEALRNSIDHGVFGYPGSGSSNYFQAIVGWQERRFGWRVEPDWIVPTSGVITALKTAIQAFTSPGDGVLIQPPVYGHFHTDVLINGRALHFAPLSRSELHYVFDAEAFEAAIQSNTRIFILSNPHNPTGNVWSFADLASMGEICARHDVLVISDEIHQDLVMNKDKKHIPYASISEAHAANSLTCTSASKTFNLAGLQNANIFIPNPRLRREFVRQYDRNSYASVNTLGMIATEASYAMGEPWVEEMLAYVRENQRIFRDTINHRTSKVVVLPMDSLYLAWIDFRECDLTPSELQHLLLIKARLWFDDGSKFGAEGQGYMRANLGCPRSLVSVAIERLLTVF